MNTSHLSLTSSIVLSWINFWRFEKSYEPLGCFHSEIILFSSSVHLIWLLFWSNVFLHLLAHWWLSLVPTIFDTFSQFFGPNSCNALLSISSSSQFHWTTFLIFLQISERINLSYPKYIPSKCATNFSTKNCLFLPYFSNLRPSINHFFLDFAI